MGRAGKNTHRQMLNNGTKEVQKTMPEHKTKAVTNNIPQPKKTVDTSLMKYGSHPNC